MTEEEFTKACHEGVWFVWTPPWDGPRLVRARKESIDLESDQYISEIRIATPNDMLKYEPFVPPRIEGRRFDIVITDDICGDQTTLRKDWTAKVKKWLEEHPKPRKE